MSIQRVGNTLLKNNFILQKTNGWKPAFQLKKSATYSTANQTAPYANKVLISTFSGTGTSDFVFNDGTRETDVNWVFSDRIETSQEIFATVQNQTYGFAAGIEIVADAGANDLNGQGVDGSTTNVSNSYLGDYAIYAKLSGSTCTLVYSETWNEDESDPNYVKIGGFHFSPYIPAYAPGTGGAQGLTINQHSIWDLYHRPKCSDPRGMVSIAGGFWCDIYFTAGDIAIGQSTSQYGAQYWHAERTNSIIHPIFGYDILNVDGTNVSGEIYPGDVYEVAHAFGKEMSNYDQFTQLAVGVDEEVSGDTWFGGIGTRPDSAADYTNYHFYVFDPSKAGYKATSQWGVIGATGCFWTWGKFQSATLTSAVSHDGRNRGAQYYSGQGALALGGAWSSSQYAGSRTLSVDSALTRSDWYLAGRLVCSNL